MATAHIVKSSTLTTTEDVTSGVTVDGVGWILKSGALTMTGLSPAIAQDGNGNDFNGFMLNPQNTQGGSPNQGWDERMNAVGNARYDASLRPSLPLSLEVGDILVQMNGTTFSPDLSASDGRVRGGTIDEVNTWIITDTVPGAEDFAGSVWGWSGRGASRFHTTTDTLDNIVAALPSYALSSLNAGDVPTVSEVMTVFDHFDPFYGYSRGTNWKNFGAYESSSVQKGVSNYGREFGAMVGAAGLMLISDGPTTAQKKQLLIRMISQGIQWAEAPIANNDSYGGNGGHHQFHHIPTAFALKYTSIGTLPDLNNIIPGNCLAQTFVVDADNVANDFVPHDDDTKPAAWRRHTVTAVSGNSITCNSQGPSSVRVTGLVLTRESDGATAIVQSGTTQSNAFTIDAQPGSAFQVGDVVYFDAPWARVIGHVDWNIQAKNRIDFIQQFGPGPDANYRALNHYGDEVMAMRAADLWDPAFDKMQTLVVNSRAANYPTAAANWPNHGDANGGFFNGKKFADAFWNAHWTAISAGTGGGGGNPVVSAFNPATGTVNFDPDGNIQITFNKPIQFGAGNITLRQNTGSWVNLEVFDVATDVGIAPGQVSISVNVLTIRPTNSLVAGRAHAVQVDATAIDDTESPVNSFAGISDDTTFNFTTATAAPVITGGTITLEIEVI